MMDLARLPRSAHIADLRPKENKKTCIQNKMCRLDVYLVRRVCRRRQADIDSGHLFLPRQHTFRDRRRTPTAYTRSSQPRSDWTRSRHSERLRLHHRTAGRKPVSAWTSPDLDTASPSFARSSLAGVCRCRWRVAAVPSSGTYGYRRPSASAAVAVWVDSCPPTL